MKRYNNLWPKICTMQNFREAYYNATKGKKHYTEVKEIEAYGVEKYLEELLEEVISKRYKVSEYIIFKRVTGGKEREIYKLPMKDRIIQHAIMIHIEPIFRENFIIDTYSSIKGRGIHNCLKRVKRAVKQKDVAYCLKLDIHKCYPSLDKEILKSKLERKFKDKDLLWLLFLIIDSCDHGVPIGNYTSQYFNNFYFSDFDHWLKETKRIKYYFRYCDDMVILENNKEKLRLLLSDIRQYIKRLNVQLKDNYQIFPIYTRGVNFLGYITRNKYSRIRKHIKHQFIRKVNRMDMLHLTEKNINVLGSYWGIIKHGDCRSLWNKYTHGRNFNEVRDNGRL